MDQERIIKIEQSIKNLSEKKSRILFLTQDTKGNARASIRHIYEMALTLKNNGFNPIILHDSNDYKGVAEWLGEEYMELPHQSIESQNLQISPEDFIVVPELYGHVLEQLGNITAGKIILCQAYDHILETLQPGATWNQYGFSKCITTTESQKEYISEIMKSVSIDVVQPTISNVFSKKEKPAKPFISVHTRDQRDTMKLIKTFYLKFPQFRWITFRDMRGLTQVEFSEALKESFLSVWVDDTGAFGTYPLESMACGTPVIGKVPNMKPEWMNDKNGIWTYDLNSLVNIVAEFTQNWLEDNIAEQLYDSGYETAQQYQNMESFEKDVVLRFTEYLGIRHDNFQTQLDKLKLEEVN